jgi:hypothetical protein
VSLTPDGTKVAFSLTSLSCDFTIDCGVRATTSVTAADGSGSTTRRGSTAAGRAGSPTTACSSNGGFLYQNQVWDVGSAAEPFDWFDDQDVYGQGSSTDLGDGDVSRNGARYVAVRGYGDRT